MPQRFYSSTLEETRWEFLVTKKDDNKFLRNKNDPK